MSIGAALGYRWDGRRSLLFFQTREGSYNSESLMSPLAAKTRRGLLSWLDLEDPDGNETRWCQVLTNETQLTGRKTMKRKSGVKETKGQSPSELIDAKIKELGDWRGRTLSRLRTLIRQADPEVVEEWKWRGVPVWSHAGMICTGETYVSANENYATAAQKLFAY